MKRTNAVRGAILLPVIILMACGELPYLDELDPARGCRRVIAVGPDPLAADTAARPDSLAALDRGADTVDEPSAPAQVVPRTVRWVLPDDDDEQRRLHAWCAAVGPALVAGWAEAPSTPIDSIAIVVWNAHAGGGQLRALVQDLRSGRLTGGDGVDHFVLLLQEVYRQGAEIPEHDPGLPGGSVIERLPGGPESGDIAADADALGLSLFYAPSMRNSVNAPAGEQEDRGNAILSTLPLSAHHAIELPVARQRRVAVSAALEGETTGGASWRLQVASLHFENDAAGLASDESARLRQARALIDALPDADRALAGGDVNTWSRGFAEAPVQELMDVYPDTPPFPPGPTYRRAYGLLRMYLDYMFFRLEDGDRGRYRRLDDLYGSDHYPLLGWVVFAPDDGA